MGRNRSLEFTYLGNLHNASYRNDVADEREIYSLLHHFRSFAHLPAPFMPIFFANDYTLRKYIFYSDNIKQHMGYDVREVLENGMELMLHITNKEYFKTLNEKVFPANLRFLKSVDQSEHQNYIFSFNNQYRKANGEWAELLQKGTFITSKESGLPVCSIGLMADITPYKKDNVIIQSIEKVDETVKRVVCLPYFL